MEKKEVDLCKLLEDTLSLSVHSASNWQTRMMYPSPSESPTEKYSKLDPLEFLGEKSFGEPRHVPSEEVGTPIQEFFRDARVLVTGGTGFIGKLLAEKLVRSVPHIGQVYLLVRPKRGKDVPERFDKLMEDQVFLRMKTEVPHYRKLISAVEGDVSKPNLGLSEHDRQLLLMNINVVFHGAADVRFTEPLRAAVESNVYGARRVLELAKDMKHLKSYVHVSTAYSQCVRRVIPEAVPKMAVGYAQVLAEIESMTDEELEKDLTRILQGWPNTYTFSKALSEEMIASERGKLPVSIFRPSAVVSTYREPVRGYTDNLYGPSGMIVGLMMGIIHCLPLPSDLALDMIPVDYVANCMIAVAYNTAQSRATDSPAVYNCTMSPHFTNGLSWKFLVSTVTSIKHFASFSQAIWTASFMMTESSLFDRTAHLFLHQIPGTVLDKIAVASGQKPMLTTIYARLQKLKQSLRFFTFNVWEFETNNVSDLRISLSKEDQQVFYFDIRDGNIVEMIHIVIFGLRYYFLKEKMETLPSAIKKSKRLVFTLGRDQIPDPETSRLFFPSLYDMANVQNSSVCNLQPSLKMNVKQRIGKNSVTFLGQTEKLFGEYGEYSWYEGKGNSIHLQTTMELDLSELVTNSLSLHSISNPQTRAVFPSSKNPRSKIFGEDPLELLGEKSFGEPRHVPREEVGTPIQEFFRDARVLVTGGTGFIGKLLAEKLVRSVPHIGQVYLLVRPKRGKDAPERFEKLMEDQVFLRMKTEVPHYRKLISAVEGDVSKPDLGLSEHDRQLLLMNINVVFHGAADVRFIEPLRAAVESNVYGARRVLELAKEMRDLKSFVHVSTAFSQCVRRVIPEAIPSMCLPYTEVLEEIKSMSDEELEKNLTRILQGWPNTYTFSKALCEEMVRSEANGLPVAIFRPSAVVTSYREPVKGYTDNLYGPLGYMLGLNMGVLHSLLAPVDLSLDMVPVDYVVNCMIAVARTTARTGNGGYSARSLTVFNFTASPHNTGGLSWKFMVALVNRVRRHWPYSSAVWACSYLRTESPLVDSVAHLFLHRVPGVVLDKIALMSGRKPLLTKIYERLQTVKPPMGFFIFNVWEFETDNIRALRDSLNADDRKLFNFDVREVSVEESLFISKLGMRYYYLKEKMDTIPAAEVKFKRLLWLHRSVKLLSGLAALKFLVIVAHLLPI